MRTKQKATGSKVGDLLPIEQCLPTDPVRLTRPRIQPSTVPGGQKYCSWKVIATQHWRSAVQEVAKAIIECQHDRSFWQWSVFYQRIDDISQRENPCIVLHPCHLLRKKCWRNL